MVPGLQLEAARTPAFLSEANESLSEESRWLFGTRLGKSVVTAAQRGVYVRAMVKPSKHIGPAAYTEMSRILRMRNSAPLNRLTGLSINRFIDLPRELLYAAAVEPGFLLAGEVWQ